MAEPRLADLKPAPAYGPDHELASVAVGSEWLRATCGPTIRRARKLPGIRGSGWSLLISFWWRNAEGKLVPSKFGRALPSADVRLLPLFARVALDAAAAAHRQGLLSAACWEAAGLTPPESDD